MDALKVIVMEEGEVKQSICTENYWGEKLHALDHNLQSKQGVELRFVSLCSL